MAQPFDDSPAAGPVAVRELAPETAPSSAVLEAAPATSGTLQRVTWRRLFLLAALLAVAWLAWQAITWPDVAALAKERPKTSAFIEAYRHGGWFTPPRAVDCRWVPYKRISRNFKRAVLVGEDMAFFSHHGFDHGEMRASLEEALQERHLPRGASTITQQLAKNLWLSPSRNPLRKVKEALLTRQLEKDLSKRRILEIYLNFVELGPGVYGVEAASRKYFGTSAAGLSNHQAAQLAASLPFPQEWHPGSKSRGYKWRTRMIERRMNKARWLDREL